MPQTLIPPEAVKPITLMKWLVRLICPPAGIVLDPFFGSGSTGVACLHEGLHFVGIERELEYVTIARARVAHARMETGQAQQQQQEAQEWECHESCPIRVLGEQSGMREVSGSARSGKPAMGNNYDHTKQVYGTGLGARQGILHNDTGTAARFFQQFPPDSLFAESEVR